jgi:GWxTD domain-containing protein
VKSKTTTMAAAAAIIFIGLLSGYSYAADLAIWADYASFKYSDSVEKTHVEIYYSLLRSQYDFQPDSNGYHSYVDMTAIVTSDSGQLIDSSSWRVGLRVNSLIEARLPNFLNNDIITAQLSPGSYSVLLKAASFMGGYTGEKLLKIDVPDFKSTGLSMSQLQLAYNVINPDGGPFDKAGKRLIPNIRRVFSHDDKLVYYYAEVYNLDSAKSEFSTTIRIYDANGNLYKEIAPSTQASAGKSASVLSGFNITAFRSGYYKLIVIATQGTDSAYAEKYLEITPGKIEFEIAQEKEELAEYPEAINITNDIEAKKFRNEIVYIASRDELRQYDALPIEGKNGFCKAFWRKRDTEPGSEVNEFKIEHYRRFKYVNEAYSTFQDTNTEPNGWKSDMGRVYIVYGTPSDEENYPSALEEKPWKRWNYDNIEGGVYFIFVDEGGYGTYRLIHSTAKSEPHNENWPYIVNPNMNKDTNPTSNSYDGN